MASGAVPVLLAISELGRGAERSGVIVVALLAALVVLAPALPALPALARLRPAALAGTLALTPLLLLADIWDTAPIASLRHRPAVAALAVVGSLAGVAALSVLITRRPLALPLLAVAAVPFRIPISSGGTTSNLLVPLYAVVAAGALSQLMSRRPGRAQPDPVQSACAQAQPAPPGSPRARLHRSPGRPAGLELALMGLVVLYALQAIYSSDFSKALEQVVFFYVPFALLFALLSDVHWTPRLLVGCLLVVVGLALVFVAIGFVEYSQRRLLLNPKVIASNQVASYFRVNSLFFDPNIYGRFLALVMIAVAGVLLRIGRLREVALAAAVLALLWAGLVLSFSQSSIAALLLGLAVLAALRWTLRWTLAAGAAALLIAAAVVVATPRTFHVDLGSSRAADNATSGRYNLVSGGVDLFAIRPLEGFGPASFAREYLRHERASSEGAVSASHTIPITVAAEQGVVGLVVYVSLLMLAFRRLFRGARGALARGVLGACFAALVLHTMLYAAFLEDPLTWVLLAAGSALALAPPREDPAGRRASPVTG